VNSKVRQCLDDFDSRRITTRFCGEVTNATSAASGCGRVGHSCRNSHTLQKPKLRVFAGAAEPRGTRRLLRLIWQASSVDWSGSQVVRQRLVAAAIGCAAVANAVATRGRHVEWLLMSCVVVLALTAFSDAAERICDFNYTSSR
jgi:hypothetical protein